VVAGAISERYRHAHLDDAGDQAVDLGSGNSGGEEKPED
jgi:hypothetical protein